MSGVLSVLMAPTPAAAGGSLAFVVGKSAGSSDGNGVTTAAIDTTGADLLVLVTSNFDGQTRTVSDSKSNTWTALTDVIVPGDTRARLYWSKPSSVGSGHTFSVSGVGNFASVAVAAFSGSHATPSDVEATGTGSSASPSAGAGVTPTQNNEVVIAGVGTNSGTISSINSSFTIVDAAVAFGSGAHYGCALAYKIQTSAAAVDPDWTNSGSTAWAAAIASFKSA